MLHCHCLHCNTSEKKNKINTRLAHVFMVEFVLFRLNNAFFVFIVFKFLVDTCPFVGPLIPFYCTSSGICSGFQFQTRQPYSHFDDVYIP